MFNSSIFSNSSPSFFVRIMHFVYLYFRSLILLLPSRFLFSHMIAYASGVCKRAYGLRMRVFCPHGFPRGLSITGTPGEAVPGKPGKAGNVREETEEAPPGVSGRGFRFCPRAGAGLHLTMVPGTAGAASVAFFCASARAFSSRAFAALLASRPRIIRRAIPSIALIIGIQSLSPSGLL